MLNDISDKKQCFKCSGVYREFEIQRVRLTFGRTVFICPKCIGHKVEIPI